MITKVQQQQTNIVNQESTKSKPWGDGKYIMWAKPPQRAYSRTATAHDRCVETRNIRIEENYRCELWISRFENRGEHRRVGIQNTKKTDPESARHYVDILNSPTFLGAMYVVLLKFNRSNSVDGFYNLLKILGKELSLLSKSPDQLFTLAQMAEEQKSWGDGKYRIIKSGTNYGQVFIRPYETPVSDDKDKQEIAKKTPDLSTVIETYDAPAPEGDKIMLRSFVKYNGFYDASRAIVELKRTGDRFQLVKFG